MDRHLGRGVHGQFRTDFPAEDSHPHVLHNHRVHTGAARLLYHRYRLRDFAVIHQRIDGQVDLYAALVTVPDRFPQVLAVKIGRVSPGVQHLGSKVYCIRALNRISSPRRG